MELTGAVTVLSALDERAATGSQGTPEFFAGNRLLNSFPPEQVIELLGGLVASEAAP
jgi:hypothetical protein